MKDGKFEPFEKVLVRACDDQLWYAGLFSHYITSSSGEQMYCVDGFCFTQCIPFEGNESLVGTTDNPKEHEHFKFGDKVQVSNFKREWCNAIYLRDSASKEYPYKAITIDSIDTYKFCRKADW